MMDMSDTEGKVIKTELYDLCSVVKKEPEDKDDQTLKFGSLKTVNSGYNYGVLLEPDGNFSLEKTSIKSENLGIVKKESNQDCQTKLDCDNDGKILGQKLYDNNEKIGKTDVLRGHEVIEKFGQSGSEICNREFKAKRNSVAGFRTDNGEYLYVCAICKKTFSLRTSHAGEKPYECTVCQKTFSQEGHLTTHRKFHTGEKPYECKVCKKKFSRTRDLSAHRRVHTEEKPYECTVCQKAFSQACNLATHERIHTGEKPYECTVCQKTFSFASNLASHRTIHTGEKPYECTVCQKTFSRAGHLSRHILIHMGKNPHMGV